VLRVAVALSCTHVLTTVQYCGWRSVLANVRSMLTPARLSVVCRL